MMNVHRHDVERHRKTKHPDLKRIIERYYKLGEDYHLRMNDIAITYVKNNTICFQIICIE